jgi:hypothetical protein
MGAPTAHQHQAIASPPPSPTLAPAVSPAPTRKAPPTPVATLLAPAPTTCPAAPPLQRQTFAHVAGFSGPITLVGMGSVWVPAPYFLTTPLHLELQGYTPWPSTKIVWEVGPNHPFAQPVEETATNLATGQLAWWRQGGDPSQSQHGYGQTLVLDADTSGPAIPHGSPARVGI